MKGKTLYVTLALIVVAVALSAGGYWWSRPSTAATSAAGEGDSLAEAFTYADNNALDQGGLPDSSTKVSIQAWFPGPVTTGGSRTLRVRLHIDQGWHVNANPASLEFLIPTTMQARANGQPVPLEVSYPPGRDSDIRLGGTTIEVYDDTTTLSAVVSADALAEAKAAGGLDIVVQAQSCSDKAICLAPAEITTRLPWS